MIAGFSTVVRVSLLSRATTAESVLENIYSLAGVTPPAEDAESVFRGHPLPVPPRGAATVFYGVWPALVAAGFLFTAGSPRHSALASRASAGRRRGHESG